MKVTFNSKQKGFECLLVTWGRIIYLHVIYVGLKNLLQLVQDNVNWVVNTCKISILLNIIDEGDV